MSIEEIINEENVNTDSIILRKEGLFWKAYEVTEEIELCEGESYQNWTETGEYQRTLQSSTGCDSIVTTDLIVHSVYEVTEEISICEGEAYNNWTETGEYFRTFTSQFGCDSVLKTNLTVESIEKPVVDVNGDTLISSSPTGNQWYLENSSIDGAINQIYVITESGNYSVQVTSENGCISEMSNAVHITYTSVDDLIQQVKIYPNPTTGLIQIEGLPENINTSIQVYTSNGQKIIDKDIVYYEASIDLSGYANGTYVINFNDDLNHSIKVVKD